MFTGIIEATGAVKDIIINGLNKTFWIESPLAAEFKVDQSVSHNGACLTVEEISGNRYRVTAIDETLQKTDLHSWKTGSLVNLERSLLVNARLDGHFVQGHVDTVATCEKREAKEGSYEFVFTFPEKFGELVIEKGSIAVNGISLTAFNVTKNSFTVAIIPYTFDHTNIHQVQPGDTVNLEFDMIGKYLLRRVSLKNN